MGIKFLSIFSSKKCLFCGSKEELTKEHIIPMWLINFLDLGDADIGMTHVNPFGGVVSHRAHTPKTLVNSWVCKKCNGGWMSELETSSKDLLMKLINRVSDKKLSSLIDRRKNLILSKWIFKTAIVLNYPTNYYNMVPKEHFKSLFDGEIPKGVYINFGFTDNLKSIEWRQSKSAILFGDLKKIEANADKIYKITLQFNYLLLRVCYVPHKDFFQVDNSISLWPKLEINNLLITYKDIDEFDVNNCFIQRGSSLAPVSKNSN